MNESHAALRALPKIDPHHHLRYLSQGRHPWLVEPVTPRMYGDYTTIDLFGPERCMFASNVPPDAIGKTYDQIFESYYAWATRYCASERRAMFHDTAAAVYGI